MGKITPNTKDGLRRIAKEELSGAKVEQALTRLEQIIQQTTNTTTLDRLDQITQDMANSPTVAQRTAAITDLANAVKQIMQQNKDTARILKHLINHIRD